MANKRQSGWQYGKREHEQGRTLAELKNEAQKMQDGSDFALGLRAYISTTENKATL